MGRRISHIQGFTLIELSIVLVIIGLLVGGVLTGQDLIKSATVRAQISQIEKYNTAVNTFQGKYDALPGDMDLATANRFGFNTLMCDGSMGARDGNGLLDGYFLMPLVQGFGEVQLFWQDLSSVNLIDGTFPNGAAVFACNTSDPAHWQTNIGQWLPVAKIGYGNFVYVYEFSGKNWYGVSATIEMSVNPASGTTIPVAMAYNIDKKIDDGLPTTGNVQALYLGADFTATTPMLAPNAAADGTTTCYNTGGSAAAYSIGYQGGALTTCALSFRFQ